MDYAWGGAVSAGMPITIGGFVYRYEGNRVTRRCAHRQAEPVILCTGELVACVCVECFEPLPARWVETQRRKARVESIEEVV